MSFAAKHIRCHGCAFEGVIQPRPIILRYNLSDGTTLDLGRAYGWCTTCNALRDIEPIFDPAATKRELDRKTQERRSRGGFLRGIADRVLGGGPDDVAVELTELGARLRLATARKSKPRCLMCAAPGALGIDFDAEGVSSMFRHSCGARLFVLPSDPDAPRFAFRPETIELDSEGNRPSGQSEESVAQASAAPPRNDAAKFNEYVDNWLTLDYELPTAARLNFFGAVEYQEMVDKGWGQQDSHAATALAIAAAYYAKLVASGHDTQARALSRRIAIVGQEAFSEGLVGMEAVASALATLEWANSRS